MPLHGTGLRVASLKISRNVERIAGHPYDDVVADHNRRSGGEIFERKVRDLHTPAKFACSGFERNQVIVRGLEIEPIAPDTDATVTDVDAALRLPFVVP